MSVNASDAGLGGRVVAGFNLGCIEVPNCFPGDLLPAGGYSFTMTSTGCQPLSLNSYDIVTNYSDGYTQNTIVSKFLVIP